MSHTGHPDVHDAGLADDCLACAEIAENPPARADEAVLRTILEHALDRAIPARSTTELVAATSVLNVLERAGRLVEVAPDLMEEYLRDRWHIDLEIGATPFTRAAEAMGLPAPRRSSPDAAWRARAALKGYIVRRGDLVPGATADAWVLALAELMNDVVVMLGSEAPPLDTVVALARRLELQP